MRALIPAVLILALALPAAHSFAAPMPSGSYQTAALAGFRVKTAQTVQTAHARKARAARKHRAEMRKKAQLRKKAVRQQQRMVRTKQSRRVIIRRRGR